MKHKMSCFA